MAPISDCLVPPAGEHPHPERQEGQQVGRAGGGTPIRGGEIGARGPRRPVGILAGLQRVDVGETAAAAGMSLAGRGQQRTRASGASIKAAPLPEES